MGVEPPEENAARRLRRRDALGALALLGLAPCLRAAAQVPEAFALPWSDVAPHREGEVVRVAAVGRPDDRIRRFAARRDSARRQARERGLAALHAWADDALASVHADPRQASRVHAVLAEAEVEAVRPRTDAGAVVVLRVDVAELRDACGREGLPWS